MVRKKEVLRALQTALPQEGVLTSVSDSVARLGCFQPHGLFSGFVGLVKFWMGWGLVGLDGGFSTFTEKCPKF